MKFRTLALIPLICLLASCGQTEQKLPQSDPLISEKQTEAPKDYVVYPDDRPSIPDGKLVYQAQNCASCHGADGGTKPEGATASLSDNRYMAGLKPVELYKAITYGKEAHHHMQGKISVKDTWNLVFYSRSLGCPALDQKQIDEINPVFGSNCAVCHGTKGDGDGPLARNLEPMPANFQTMKRFFDRTDDTLFDHIANGIKWEGMPNFLGKEDKKKNVKFDHEYIRKLVQYVRNFHVSNEGTAIASAGTATPKADAAAPAAAPAAGESKPADDAAKTSEPAASTTSTATSTATGSAETPAAESKGEEKKSEAPAADKSAEGEASKVTNGKTEDKSH